MCKQVLTNPITNPNPVSVTNTRDNVFISDLRAEIPDLLRVIKCAEDFKLLQSTLNIIGKLIY
jgi:hypothetical protein